MRSSKAPMKLFQVIAKVQVEVVCLVHASNSAEAEAAAMKLPLNTTVNDFAAWSYNWNRRDSIVPFLANQIITVEEL